MISTPINVFQETLKGFPELIYFSWTILPAPSRSSSRWSMIRTWVKIYLIGFREDSTPSKLIKVRLSSGMYNNLISRTIRTAGVPPVDPSSLSWFKKHISYFQPASIGTVSVLNVFWCSVSSMLIETTRCSYLKCTSVYVWAHNALYTFISPEEKGFSGW